MSSDSIQSEYISKRLRVEHGEVQYYVFGDGDHDVIALPSFPFSGLYYVNLIQSFPNLNARFITLDLPGWAGWSDVLNREREISVMDDFVDVLSEIAAVENLDKYSIIGYSFGASLAVKLAARDPESVNAIALVSSVLFGSEFNNSPRSFLVKFLNNIFGGHLLFKEFIYRRFKLFVPQMESKWNPASLRLFTSMVANADSKVILQSAVELFETSLRRELLEIDDEIPIIVANSTEESNFFQRQSKLLRDLLKHEKNIFLSGTHNDFIMNAEQEPVYKLLEMLVSDNYKT
jgi:pimeloyl-ACP methyl ester carboxylesterase